MGLFSRTLVLIAKYLLVFLIVFTISIVLYEYKISQMSSEKELCPPPYTANKTLVKLMNKYRVGVELKLEKEVYRSNESIKYKIINTGERTLLAGAPFKICKYENGKWYVVKPVKEIVFVLVAYPVEPGQSITLIAPLEPYYKLEPGLYKLVTKVLVENLNLDIILEAKFQITK